MLSHLFLTLLNSKSDLKGSVYPLHPMNNVIVFFVKNLMHFKVKIEWKPFTFIQFKRGNTEKSNIKLPV